MGALLPDEVLKTVLNRHEHRRRELFQLNTLYTGLYPSLSTLVIHGPAGTDKCEVVESVLLARQLKYALVRCQETLSQRHLLPKIFASCLRALNSEVDVEEFQRVDSVNTLAVNLEKTFRLHDEKLILVLDELDDHAGASSSLFPALARLGDLIPQISLIMVTSSTRIPHFARNGVPFLFFPALTRQQAVHTMGHRPAPVPPSNHDLNVENLQQTWQSFILTVYDSLIAPTTPSFNRFEELCIKLWPRFLWPAVSGEYPPGKRKKWDFASLLVKNRGIFQRFGEDAMLDRLQLDNKEYTFTGLQSRALTEADAEPEFPSTPSRKDPQPAIMQQQTTEASTPPLLNRFSSLLVLASYLASHTPSKQDIVLFSRMSSHSMTKSGRVRKTPKKSPFKSPSKGSAHTTPTKPGESVAEAKMPARSKNVFDLKFGAPKAFSMERLLAILRAIHPDGIAWQKGIGDRLYQEMSELERLRLVILVDDEEIEGGGKWRINVSREWVMSIASRHGLSVTDWEFQEQQ